MRTFFFHELRIDTTSSENKVGVSKENVGFLRRHIIFEAKNKLVCLAFAFPLYFDFKGEDFELNAMMFVYFLQILIFWLRHW